jgi:site-specific recombinase XerD
LLGRIPTRWRALELRDGICRKNVSFHKPLAKNWKALTDEPAWSTGQDRRLPCRHPHQLRHACGYKLANDGHDTRAIQHYLGHENVVHTVRYTNLAPDRFKSFWRD